MISKTQQRIDRREWLARCARPAVLMGIVLLVLRLLRRDRQGVCRHPELRCGGCQLLAQCDTRRAHLAVTTRRARIKTVVNIPAVNIPVDPFASKELEQEY